MTFLGDSADWLRDIVSSGLCMIVVMLFPMVVIVL